MAEIAVLGYGTVGSGVIDVLNTNQMSIDKKAGQPIRVKYILDLRDFPGTPIQRLIVHDFNKILHDDEIKVVVEVMGGVEPAYTFVKQSLLKGKSVVTSNKELVATHGAELLQLARENNINFMFEASVGGGIPIIRPLNQSLTADEIYEINGILNGTTNYILTKMTKEGREFSDVLKQAQDKGYAEKNPSADVDGHDTCRKLAILLSLAIGKHVDYEKIYTEGITAISKTDIDYVKKAEKSIKLLATAKITGHSVYAKVCPTIINEENPLSHVHDVFNAILIRGNVIGDVMFYGKGAGKLPTASAVVADVIDAIKHLNRNIMYFWSTEKPTLLDVSDMPIRKFIRIAYADKEKAIADIKNIFTSVEWIELDDRADVELAFFTTETEKETLVNEKIKMLEACESIVSIVSSINYEA